MWLDSQKTARGERASSLGLLSHTKGEDGGIVLDRGGFQHPQAEGVVPNTTPLVGSTNLD